jgi:hypothetical protein
MKIPTWSAIDGVLLEAQVCREGFRYRAGVLARHGELRRCDRCLSRRCHESARPMEVRSWKRYRRHQYRAR